MFEKINSKVVKADLGRTGPIVSRRGSMLFYSGQVHFAPHQIPGAGGAPGGMGAMVGSMMRSEHERTMIAQGNGQVHYGFQGLALHVIDLPQGGQVTADMSRMLGYTAGMQASIVSTQSQQGGGGGLRGALRGAATGALTGNGMFTTQLSGVGAVVLVAHGELIEIPVGNGPVVVDPQAFVGTVGNVQTQLQSAMSWRDAVGRGSGEAMQLQCNGQGLVLVQASEEKL